MNKKPGTKEYIWKASHKIKQYIFEKISIC